MKTVTLKRTVVAGVAALTLAGAALGVVGAQQAPAFSPSQPQIAFANRGSTTTEQQALRFGPGGPGGQEQHEKYLSALAKNLGVSTDKLKQAFEDTRKELGMPERGPGGPRGGHHGEVLSAAATALGISVDELKKELPGKSMTQVAEAHKVRAAIVEKALKDAMNKEIDEAAAAGRIPSDKVAEAKQRAAQRIEQMMTQAMPTGGPGGRGPRP